MTDQEYKIREKELMVREFIREKEKCEKYDV